jgi:molecular chaperone HtpG
MNDFTHSFEADTGKILNIVINSLYSDRDIFLRELLSNASDAIHKRRFIGQTTPETLNALDDEIQIIADPKKKTIEIIDTGIGLSEAELSETFGTIARSGTSAFMDDLQTSENSKDAAKTLIGKFGVGFYSAFMVADRVVVTTRKAGTDKSHIWESDGQSGYSISLNDTNVEEGTSVKLYLRKDAKEYADANTLRTLVKKYSDHILVPINLKSIGGENEQANSAQALWTRAPSEIKTEDYTDFYKSNFGAFEDPFITIHNKTEGSIDFTNLLFIPKSAPFDLFEPERKTKINLYINRVFISNDVDGIIPVWLRFVQGILDTTSLDLNVSRELVQSSPVIKKISKYLTKRILSELKKKQKKDSVAYEAFWSQFGKVLKEGLYEDIENREKIADVIRVYSFQHNKLISLQDYLDGFIDSQKTIFYLTADTLKQAKSSPHLEGFKAKGVDVLLMTDPIDAFWMTQMASFKEKSFVSISRDKYDLSELDAEEVKEADDQTVDEVSSLIKECLADVVEDVIQSKSLVDSPVRLVAGEGGMDFNLERILKAQNPEFEGGKKVMEVNLDHELIKKLPTLSNELQKVVCRILFEQARILDGEMPADVHQFTQDLMHMSLNL